MIRMWAGIGLLACSWLPGLGYYAPSSPVACAVMILVGTALLAGAPVSAPSKRDARVAATFCLIAAWLMPWPYCAAALLIFAGLALPAAAGWPRRAGQGALAAGVVLLSQSVLMGLYAIGTARSHDLPRPLAHAAGAVIRLLGAEAAVDGTDLAISASGKVHHFGLTWDLFIDPVTLGFLMGGSVVLAILAYASPQGHRAAAWLRAAGTLALVMAAWLPLRTALIVGLLIQQIDRATPGLPLNGMESAFSPWLHLGLLAGPILLAWRLVPKIAGSGDERQEALPTARRAGPRLSRPATLCLAAAGALMLAFLFHWDPIGGRKPGRVMVVERHSTWEPTTRPYDTESYGEPASYTYAAIYDYCSRFYTMSRLLESDRIDSRTLSGCDVLVIKTPTAPYLPNEVAAVVRFVEQGGGLLLIGEHTDVFQSSTYLNQIAEPFGFQFRKDLLFRVGSPYVQQYEPPAVPHPAVQNLPSMHFAVSCSIDPGPSRGCGAVRNSGLWSLPPAYHTDNYFPEAEYRTDMRYGAFNQLWATRHGSGRVLAWTDSTIFSNFSAFEPGKTELMLGMLEWLNRRSLLDNVWVRVPVMIILGLAGLAAISAGLIFSAARGAHWLMITSTVLAAWGAGSSAVAVFQRLAMPLPEPVQPMVQVVIDRTVSEVPLARGGFTVRDGRGYGLLEQWIPRLGWFTARRSGQAAFTGDLLVVICPSRSVNSEYRQGLVDYVAAGGKLLVIDSPDSAGSTANSLLWPFGLVMNHGAAAGGPLHGKDSWPDIPVEAACAVGGGEPLYWAGDVPVAARTTHGKGTVIAIGFGRIFNDTGMGQHWMAEPDEATRTRFELWYRLLRMTE